MAGYVSNADHEQHVPVAMENNSDIAEQFRADGPSDVEQDDAARATGGFYEDLNRFDIDDETRWLAHLEREGYVIIRSCADSAQVDEARCLLWTALENTTPARRDDPASWDAWRLDRRGFSMHGSVTQGHGAWFLRSLPIVHHAFASIWKQTDLICSMDLVLIWRPWWLGSQKWLPKTEGLHVDQNPLFKKEFECVQGMIPLYDVTEQTGGLEVVPRSHSATAKELFVSQCGEHMQSLGDFCKIPPNYYGQYEAVLLTACAGDLILWDSRTVHGGKVGTGVHVPNETCIPQLARLSLPVCMTPRNKASDETLRLRRAIFNEGKTTNHWPHAPRVQNQVSLGYVPIELSPAQEALI